MYFCIYFRNGVVGFMQCIHAVYVKHACAINFMLVRVFETQRTQFALYRGANGGYYRRKVS